MLSSRKPFASVSKRHLLMMAVGFSTVLTGCATSPTSKVASSTKVEYYPNCYEPVQHLRATDSTMPTSVVTGAAVGAVGGALLGALTDSENRGRNAAIGAAGGAVAGGAAGYYTERQKQITDDNQRIASYATDVNKSAADIDRSTAYAKTSQQCYQNAFTKLVADRKAKTVFYDSPKGARAAYTILGGDTIDAPSGAYEKDMNGVKLFITTDHGRRIVTWTRNGHTCVLSAPVAVPEEKLLELAAWKVKGNVPF